MRIKKALSVIHHHRQKQSFWWDIFIRSESGKDQFVRQTKAVSAEKAVNNVWYTDFRNPYDIGAMEEAKLLRYRMYARLTPPRTQEPPPRYHHHSTRGQLLLFRKPIPIG